MASANYRTSATNVHNQLLAAWPSEVWAHVGSDLERVELVQGQTLHEAGTALKYVYFPISAVVSLVSGMQDGGSAEVAVVGHEGVVGVCAFMDGAVALSGGEVQTAGHAWRMRAPVLANHVARHAAMALPLLRYTQALLVQLAQTAACNRHHSLHQQLCRWLLLHQDRHRCDEFLVTHARTYVQPPGRAARDRHRLRIEAAEGRLDPLWPRPPGDPGPQGARRGELRVLRGGQVGLRQAPLQPPGGAAGRSASACRPLPYASECLVGAAPAECLAGPPGLMQAWVAAIDDPGWCLAAIRAGSPRLPTRCTWWQASRYWIRPSSHSPSASISATAGPMYLRPRKAVRIAVTISSASHSLLR